MAINVTVLKNGAQDAPNIFDIKDRFKFGMGVLNNSYVLDTQNITDDDFVVMFDTEAIGRGFEIKADEEKYEMTLPLPCSTTDIAIFYDTVQWLCEITNADCFYQDGDRVEMKYLGYCKDGAVDTSTNSMFDICDSIWNDENEHYVLYCSHNPIVIGKEMVREILSLEDFGEMMDRLQKWDAFYPTLRFYNGPDDTIFAAFFVGDGIPTIVPTEKFVPWSTDFEISEWYVVMPGRAMIKFDDFIKRVEKMEDYDCKHIIISLDENQIADFEMNLNYSLDDKEYSPLVYWGKQIDSGHDYKIEDKNLPLDRLCGFNHLAVYLRYGAEKGLLSHEFVDKIGREVALRIKKNLFDVRDFIANDEFVGGEICSRYFEPEFSLFTKQFYVFGSDSGFPATVDKIALEYWGEEKYNCKEFDDEAYLFVPYDDEYYKTLSAEIDKAWKKFKRARK